MKRRNFFKIVCRHCNGNGVILIGNEWEGGREESCIVCKGEGMVWFHRNLANNGFKVFSPYVSNVDDGFYIMDSDFANLYIRRGNQYFHWANWSVGTIQKIEEEELWNYQLEGIFEKFEGNMALMIKMFYESKEKWIYCEYTDYNGNPYSELEL